MDASVWERIKDHPCYSEEAHHYFARMHVAVAPACNIQCNYCNRKYDCANESRPGVVSEKLTPDEARRKVIAVANEVPQLSVLGIAGPGRRLLRLEEDAGDLRRDLQGHSRHQALHLDQRPGAARPRRRTRGDERRPRDDHHQHGRSRDRSAKSIRGFSTTTSAGTGVEASKILHERQMLGLEMLTARGILTKINSVMIPGVNDEHLIEVNRWVKERGAFLHNVMPLISDPAHGTHYGLTGQRGPTAMELKALQDKLEGGAKLMRHCRQCRADAVGLLGEDRGQEFTLDQLPEEVAYDPSKREAYREIVARSAATMSRPSEKADGRDQGDVGRGPIDAGRGRDQGRRPHQRALRPRQGVPDLRGLRRRASTFVGHRKVDAYCMGGFGEDATLDATIAALEGVSHVLCAKIGDCPKDMLERGRHRGDRRLRLRIRRDRHQRPLCAATFAERARQGGRLSARISPGVAARRAGN